MGHKIKLVAELEGTYIFEYEEYKLNGFLTGFVYENKVWRGDGERRYRDQPMGSIAAHMPYMFDNKPTTVFTPEELERIANLPVYGSS